MLTGSRLGSYIANMRSNTQFKMFVLPQRFFRYISRAVTSEITSPGSEAGTIAPCAIFRASGVPENAL